MSATDEVTLLPARRDDATLLGNLLELYVHDLSEVFDVTLGADGRFGYDKLPLYWQEAERRFPFLVRHGGVVAGFALATRGSPATSDPDDLDVAEFFVLRAHRRANVGRVAAGLLWDRLRGRWVVRVSQGNRGALAFWPDVIAGYTGGSFDDTTRPGTPHPWRVFSFRSR